MLAACALSVAVVAPASASIFLASAVGALVLNNQLSSQKLQLDAGNLECTKVSSHGKTTALSSLTLLETVRYTGCNAFGSTFTVTPAEYQFNADKSVSVLSNLVLTSTLGKCSLKIGPSGNQSLKTVLYIPDPNNNKALNIKAEISGISYLSTGGICGPTGELKNGVLIGESLAFLDGGGTLAWDA